MQKEALELPLTPSEQQTVCGQQLGLCVRTRSCPRRVTAIPRLLRRSTPRRCLHPRRGQSRCRQGGRHTPRRQSSRGWHCRNPRCWRRETHPRCRWRPSRRRRRSRSGRTRRPAIRASALDQSRRRRSRVGLVRAVAQPILGCFHIAQEVGCITETNGCNLRIPTRLRRRPTQAEHHRANHPIWAQAVRVHQRPCHCRPRGRHVSNHARG